MRSRRVGLVILALASPSLEARADVISPYAGNYWVNFSYSGLVETPQAQAPTIATVTGTSYFTGYGTYVRASSTTLSISGIPALNGTYNSSDPLFFGSLTPFISITYYGAISDFDVVSDYNPYGVNSFELHINPGNIFSSVQLAAPTIMIFQAAQ